MTVATEVFLLRYLVRLKQRAITPDCFEDDETTSLTWAENGGLYGLDVDHLAATVDRSFHKAGRTVSKVKLPVVLALQALDNSKEPAA